ncbi:MAG: hypothetical protein OJF49_003326 [Ktedonobacterales bacterium]|jgi:hypothetical protein|nr:MAG: hypothetical protein OJF49_003326 [Ktedonobacterales bacterium]
MSRAAHQDEQRYDEVLEIVRHWTSSQRLYLVQDILKTLEPEVERQTRKPVSGADAEGILAGPWPAPTDAEVEKLAGDYLSEKYG